MIEKITLENYRGFRKHSIPFNDLNVIVGSNNAGKSTVVEGLRLLSFVANRYRNLAFKKVPEWLDINIINKGVAPSLKYTEINFDSICNQYNNEDPAEISADFTDGSNISIYLNNEGKIHAVIRNPKGKVVSSRTNTSSVRLPNISILPQVAPVRRDEVILDSDYVKSALGSSLSPLHFRNQLKIFPQYFDDFQKTVEETWPGVMVRQLIFNDNLPETSIFLQIRNENFVAEISEMGHGLQMWLQVIWFLTLSKNSEIIILDEPDVYMHADLQKRLIRLIKNRFPQVIITSHSIEIMSEVNPSEILIINKSTNQSSFANTIPAVQRLAESTGSIQNINLSRLWNAKKFIMVEGKDLKYLKILQNIIFPKSLSPFDSIPNMVIGGWSGWSYAIGSSMLLLNSFKEKLKIYCILDSDYHTKNEINERLEDAKSKKINLHIWSKKEIENYLIVPSVIQRLISKRSQNKFNPTLKEIVEQIQKCTFNLKDDTTDCIANEIHLRNKSKGITFANKSARSYVKSIKKSNGDISSIVSGKEIITRVSEWTQKMYKVSISSLSILTEIQKNEIHPELIKIIMSLEKGGKF